MTQNASNTLNLDLYQDLAAVMQPETKRQMKQKPNNKLTFGNTHTNKVRQTAAQAKNITEHYQDLLVRNSKLIEGPGNGAGIQLLTKDSSIIQLIEKAKKIEKQRKMVEKMIKIKWMHDAAKNMTLNNSIIINNRESSSLSPKSKDNKQQQLSPIRQSYESEISQGSLRKSKSKILVLDIKKSQKHEEEVAISCFDENLDDQLQNINLTRGSSIQKFKNSLGTKSSLDNQKEKYRALYSLGNNLLQNSRQGGTMLKIGGITPQAALNSVIRLQRGQNSPEQPIEVKNVNDETILPLKTKSRNAYSNILPSLTVPEPVTYKAVQQSQIMFASPSKSILNMPAEPFIEKQQQKPTSKGLGGFQKSRKTSLDTQLAQHFKTISSTHLEDPQKTPSTMILMNGKMNIDYRGSSVKQQNSSPTNNLQVPPTTLQAVSQFQGSKMKNAAKKNKKSFKNHLTGIPKINQPNKGQTLEQHLTTKPNPIQEKNSQGYENYLLKPQIQLPNLENHTVSNHSYREINIDQNSSFKDLSQSPSRVSLGKKPLNIKIIQPDQDKEEQQEGKESLIFKSLPVNKSRDRILNQLIKIHQRDIDGQIRLDRKQISILTQQIKHHKALKENPINNNQSPATLTEDTIIAYRALPKIVDINEQTRASLHKYEATDLTLEPSFRLAQDKQNLMHAYGALGLIEGHQIQVKFKDATKSNKMLSQIQSTQSLLPFLRHQQNAQIRQLVLQNESYFEERKSSCELDDNEKEMLRMSQHEDVIGQIAKSRNLAIPQSTHSRSPSKASYITIDGSSAGLSPLVVIPLEPSGQFQGQSTFINPRIAVIKDDLIDNYLYGGQKSKKAPQSKNAVTKDPDTQSNGSGIYTYSQIQSESQMIYMDQPQTNVIYSTIDTPRKASNGGAVPEPVHDEEGEGPQLKYSRSQHVLREPQNKQSFHNRVSPKKMTILQQNETLIQVDKTIPLAANAQFNINKNKIQPKSAINNQHRSQNQLQKEYNLSEKEDDGVEGIITGPEPVSKYIIGLPNPQRLSNVNSQARLSKSNISAATTAKPPLIPTTPKKNGPQEMQPWIMQHTTTKKEQ